MTTTTLIGGMAGWRSRRGFRSNPLRDRRADGPAVAPLPPLLWTDRTGTAAGSPADDEMALAALLLSH